MGICKKEDAKASSFLRQKASPSGLRPQARVEAQPPEAALSAETEAVRVSGLMRGELAFLPFCGSIAANSPLIRPSATFPRRGKA